MRGATLPALLGLMFAACSSAPSAANVVEVNLVLAKAPA